MPIQAKVNLAYPIEGHLYMVSLVHKRGGQLIYLELITYLTLPLKKLIYNLNLATMISLNKISYLPYTTFFFYFL